jgi:hypothetical protein
MKWLGRISTALLGLIAFVAGKKFFRDYELLIMSKDDIAEMQEEFRQMDSEPYMDLRGTPTHVCVCGSDAFYLKATFKDFEIATYMLDMQCANCGSLATAPTPIDYKQD